MAILPVLPVTDVTAAIDHYVTTLGFTEDFRVPDEAQVITSGQVRLGDNTIMLNLNPEDAPKQGGGIWLWLRVDDMPIDVLYATMSTARDVTVIEEIGDRFWGDRSFAIRDALGYTLAFNSKIDQSAGASQTG